MPYKVTHFNHFVNDLAVYAKSGNPKKKLVAKMEAIIKDPFIGDTFTGDEFKGLHKYRLHGRPEYRVIYRVYNCCRDRNEIMCPHSFPDPDMDVMDDECEGVIQFVFLKTREETDSYYKKGKGNFDKSLLDDFDLK
jgi:hypothetical protein